MNRTLVQFQDYVDSIPREVLELQSWVDEVDTTTPIDLGQMPCDASIMPLFDAVLCAQIGVVPWQKLGQSIVVLAPNDDVRERAGATFNFQTLKIVYAHATQSDIDKELRRVASLELIHHAKTTCPEHASVRNMASIKARLVGFVSIATLAISIFLNPSLLLSSLISFATLFVFGNAFLRLLALVKTIHERKKPPYRPNITVPNNGWPVITVLVPLFRETEVVFQLLENLISIDYPEEKLDIKLLLEEDDDTTRKTVESITLPHFIEQVLVPIDGLRTKPKAMNFALPFCRGDVVGIYDAEDKPDILQLRHVAHQLALGGDKTACVQFELDFYNTRQNWFTRCFTIEYRIWFATVLPMVQSLGMAVPLGGTSVFVRRDVLEKCGAWDAHNVTEDADLGIRLKRMGYETIVIHNKTMEEANPHALSWVRQRSRWLKGYMMTWLSHMRNPFALWRDLGGVGFIGIQIMFLGTIINYLATPLFWAMWPLIWGRDLLGFLAMPYPIRTAFFTVMVFAQVVNLALAFMALRKNDNTRDLFKWYLTMPLYWPFGVMAAYKALFEMMFAPFYWDKTSHGSQENTKLLPAPSPEAVS